MVGPVNVMDVRSRAREALAPGPWGYLASGAEDEGTLEENRRAFRRIRFVPRVLRDVSDVDLSTTVLGREVPFPVLLAPAGFQGLFHPDAELATARAAEETGALMVVSTLSSRPMEEVAEAGGRRRWFQLYAYRDREITATLVRRAEEAGYRAICLTVDTPRLGRREADVRNRLEIPPEAMPANFAGLVDVPEGPGAGSAVAAQAEELLDPSLTWNDLEWLVDRTELPVVVKGVVAPGDAVRAVDAGARAVVVSNHGGRQLDDTVATIEALEGVADAVGDRAEVLLDGGVRRGRDVAKAVALGARAVLVGRPYLWGLAADGEAGVRRVLEMLRDELEGACALLGCPSAADIPRDRVEWRTRTP